MTRLTVCVVLVAMLISAGSALAQEGLEESCWYDRLCLAGYFQARYVDTDRDDMNDNFDFRRMFVTIRGDVDRTTGIVTFARVGPDDPNIDLYNAFVDYSFGDRYAVQFGQVPTWFGLEAWEGSSVRDTLERAMILEGGGQGFWFAGAADRGIWLRRMPTADTWEPLVVLGAWNGQFRNDDANNDKNISLDLKWSRDWGMFGASWFDGTYVDGSGVENPREAIDLYVRVFPQPFGFQAEWADGEMFGVDRDGYYLHANYDLPNGTDRAYARWQEFCAEMPGGNLEYDAWTVGFIRQLDENNELTLEYTDGDWEAGSGVGVEQELPSGSDDMLALQWQYSFR